MQNKLRVNGKQEFMGLEIPVIEGGFGENQKCVLLKTISEIHKVDIKEVNKLINNNIDEFEFGIDIIDLKTGDYQELVLEKDLLTKAQWGNANHVYLLSEQGYMALASLMRTNKAKETRKQFRREYFSMREIILSDEQLKATLLLSIYNGGQEGILASKKLTEIEVIAATTPLLETIEDQRSSVEFAEHVSKSTDTIDIGKLSKIAKDEHIEIGRNRLFEYLRKKQILMKDNIPYQRYLEQKWFEVIEGISHTAYGDKFWTKTLVTGRGQINIIEMLRNDFL